MSGTKFSIQIFIFMLFLGAVSCQPRLKGPPNDMVTIPAGWFYMGSQRGRRSNQPSRMVYLSSYAMDRLEVTNIEYGEFIKSEMKALENPYLDLYAPNEPVTGVTWRLADRFCRWRGKRLPTEAEWEKAARGTDGRDYPWGDEWSPWNANTHENGPGRAVSVGSYPQGASPYGLFDMSGNAAEWVADYFDPTYYEYGEIYDPAGPFQVLDHVIRGGSWDSSAEHATVYFRDSSHSVQPNNRVGFRCAISIE